MARTFSYQWQRNNGSWGDIGGATSKNYTPVAADYGYPLRLAVTPSDGSTPGYSNATNAVSSPLVQAIAALSGLIAYWPLDDLSGTVITSDVSASQNGTNGGATVNQNTTNGVVKAYSFDGINDYGDVYSTALTSAFNGPAGTAFIFMNGANMGTTTTRRLFFMSVNGSNFISGVKSATPNTVVLQYVAGGTTRSVSIGSVASNTWYLMAMTWDKAADEMKVYLNNAQSGSTQTGLGTWAGTFASTTTCIGASSNAGAQPWEQYLAHMVLCNVALPLATIQSIASLGGV